MSHVTQITIWLINEFHSYETCDSCIRVKDLTRMRYGTCVYQSNESHETWDSCKRVKESHGETCDSCVRVKDLTRIHESYVSSDASWNESHWYVVSNSSVIWNSSHWYVIPNIHGTRMNTRVLYECMYMCIYTYDYVISNVYSNVWHEVHSWHTYEYTSSE